jgi:hypothetical protein
MTVLGRARAAGLAAAAWHAAKSSTPQKLYQVAYMLIFTSRKIKIHKAYLHKNLLNASQRHLCLADSANMICWSHAAVPLSEALPHTVLATAQSSLLYLCGKQRLGNLARRFARDA